MEAKLNCVLMLSLRDMTLGRIAVVLVNNPELSDAIKGFPFYTFHYFDKEWIAPLWKDVEHTVSKLPLPALLREETIPVLKAVASEILKWKIIHSRHIQKIDQYIHEKLCWTTAGTIDYQKTCKRIVGLDVFDVEMRFELACIYCLEDCIPVLWNKLPKYKKWRYSDRRDRLRIKTPSLQLLLSCVSAEIFSSMSYHLIDGTSFRSDSCRYSIIFGTKAATEYFLKKEPEEKRKSALIETARRVIQKKWLHVGYSKRPDILSYLLSLMTSEEQFEFLKCCACDVILHFLDWPWQDLCLEIADIAWTFIDESKYNYLLGEIKTHIRKSGFYLPNFIRKFFSRSPMKFRKSLLNEECRNIFFFKEFLCEEDYKSIRVIFSSIDAVDKERLLFSKGFLELLDGFLLNDQQNIVEEGIKLAQLSKDDCARLKEAFVELVTETDSEIDESESNRKKNKLKFFFQLLDTLKMNATEKRNEEGENLQRIKKLCTEQENLFK